MADTGNPSGDKLSPGHIPIPEGNPKDKTSDKDAKKPPVYSDISSDERSPKQKTDPKNSGDHNKQKGKASSSKRRRSSSSSSYSSNR